MELKPHANDLWNKTGQIEIYIDNEVIGRGNYKLKKIIAVNRAADDAYKNLFAKIGNKHGAEPIDREDKIDAGDTNSNNNENDAFDKLQFFLKKFELDHHEMIALVSNLGLKRLSGYIVMRWALRDALTQLLGCLESLSDMVEIGEMSRSENWVSGEGIAG
ncbi:hypothetical protein L1987_70686 [Smallanthus sonchifolius]|uniref:Uncharacterized protein n=1 Tax=Smallanthus sonchifolius TaxID=185202 RepID=A0ACB9AQJ9_9ASTR|nr:hypothetical protein L1987_70686 [Smallanthus sonchifolius]